MKQILDLNIIHKNAIKEYDLRFHGSSVDYIKGYYVRSFVKNKENESVLKTDCWFKTIEEAEKHAEYCFIQYKEYSQIFKDCKIYIYKSNSEDRQGHGEWWLLCECVDE